MHKLTIKQKFALLFSLYVFIFIFILSSLFFLTFQISLFTQFKKDINREATEIINNHIVINNNKIDISKDKNANNLKNELLENNFSVLIFDKNTTLLKSYGLFDIYRDDDKKNVFDIVKKSQKILKDKTSFGTEINWRSQKLYALFAPLKMKNNIYGVLIISKSLDQLNNINQIMFFVFGSISIIGFIGSFILGNIFVVRFLKPVKNLTNVIDKIDLEGLDKSVEVDGNPKDEFVILGNKFNEMTRRLKNMSEQQKDFISNASHELKTPLTKAISTLEIAIYQNKISNKELSLVKQDLFDMNNLIDELLFLSRLKKGVKNNSRIKLKLLIDSILKLYKSELDQKKITFFQNIDNQLLINLPQKYAEVLFSNLISNAIKYSHEKTKITVKSYSHKNKILVEIIDQGIGMNNDELNNIFNRFFRGREGKSMSSGFGIGFSIIKQICELYDIKIGVESEKYKGTKIILAFAK